ncbi:MAG: CopG family transcriptional regulator [Gemmatimonadaceae bacterium]
MFFRAARPAPPTSANWTCDCPNAPLHRALRLKAAETDASISELVNAAIRRSLAEDANDLAAFHGRAKKPRVSFEGVVRDLKKRDTL